MTDPEPSPTARLLDALHPEQSGRDEYVGRNPQDEGRLFGGLVAAQSIVAAGITVPEDLPLHSLHAYFIRPGKPRALINYRIDRLKEGRNFHTREVVARQGAEVIFSLYASFTRPEEGVSHQAEMPKAPPPESGIERSMRFTPRFFSDAAIETRVCDPEDPNDNRRFLWIRPKAPLPEDPLAHTAVYVFMSDRALVSTAVLPFRKTHERKQVASLDHSLWFHRHVPFNDWVLYAMESPVAHSGRGLIYGAMYAPDGSRIMSSAQEGLIHLEPK